jgi:hypothetical protein
MSGKGNGGAGPGRTRSVFHRRGGRPALRTAFRNDRIDTADNPLQLPRAAVRASQVNLLFPLLHEQFHQPLALLTDELIYGQILFSSLER